VQVRTPALKHGRRSDKQRTSMAQDARERFAKKNEAEDLRRAFDKLDTKGYVLFNVMMTACMTLSFPQ